MVDDDAYAAPVRHLVRVAEETEPRDVGDGVREEGPHRVGRGGVERCHLLDCRRDVAVRRQHEAGAERLREEERIAGLRAALRPDAVGMHRADDREPVLRLRVADRVAAGENRACRTYLLCGGREDGTEHLGRKLFREGGDRQSEERRAAHRVHIVERIRRRNPAEGRWIVDERREEVEREDDRPLVVELVDGRIIGRREPDQEVLRFDGDEAPQQLFEAGCGVLRGAAAAGRQSGE